MILPQINFKERITPCLGQFDNPSCSSNANELTSVSFPAMRNVHQCNVWGPHQRGSTLTGEQNAADLLKSVPEQTHPRPVPIYPCYNE
ncbi:hypothetical protein M514_27450 [Trichuris suis]|uniref:Uncharacterized protein n=1 Tax=Trichuris suis TaxID=68888 RepID=A0A085MT19_9BILA|nr:hypothetical protein M514_27450 [Trichuris suis]